MAWSNWSGSVTASGEVARPQSEDELAALVRSANKLRVTGAGHSFMPLCESGELGFLARPTAKDKRRSYRIPRASLLAFLKK